MIAIPYLNPPSHAFLVKAKSKQPSQIAMISSLCRTVKVLGRKAKNTQK